MYCVVLKSLSNEYFLRFLTVCVRFSRNLEGRVSPVNEEVTTAAFVGTISANGH